MSEDLQSRGMPAYQAEELCDLIKRMRVHAHAHADQLNMRQVMDYPLLRWPDPDGLEQRVRWIRSNQTDLGLMYRADVNEGDTSEVETSRTRKSGALTKDLSTWKSRVERPLPCTSVSAKTWENWTGIQGLISFICHCADHPLKSALRLPDSVDNTAEIYDALGRYFMRLVPTLFATLFERGLRLDRGPWQLSAISQPEPHAQPSAAEAPIIKSNFERRSNPSGEEGCT